MNMVFSRLGITCLSLRGSDGGIGGNDDDGGTADRAVDVGAEPGVDAGRVERVRAAREEAHQLPVAELAEAHRAVPAPAHHPAAVLHGGYGRDGGLVEPHRPDVPHVVHHPSSTALLLVAEPSAAVVVVGPFGGGRRREASAAPQDEAAAAVEEERGEREREEEEGGEQGDDEEEAHGRVAVGGDRRARDHRERGRRGQGVRGAGRLAAAGAEREAVERCLRAVEDDRRRRRVRAHRVHGWLPWLGQRRRRRSRLGLGGAHWRGGGGGGLVRVGRGYVEWIDRCWVW